MSRCEQIGRCIECGNEFRYGDCFTQYCFDHDPAKAESRAMLATKRKPGEPIEAWMNRVREAAAQSRAAEGSYTR